jgi:hypothetical protein
MKLQLVEIVCVIYRASPRNYLIFTQVASALAQVRSGQVKAYAVMAKARWAEACQKDA